MSHNTALPLPAAPSASLPAVSAFCARRVFELARGESVRDFEVSFAALEIYREGKDKERGEPPPLLLLLRASHRLLLHPAAAGLL